MTNDFDPNWPHGHMTTDGRKARIICTDARNSLNIVCLITNEDHEICYVADKYGQGSIFNLVNAPAPKKTFEFWVNVYPDGFACLYRSKENANAITVNDRIARKKIIVTEGEFDE